MSHVTCHMSRGTCHVSHVTCHMSRVTCHFFLLLLLLSFSFFLDKVLELIGGGSVINGATPSSFLGMARRMTHPVQPINYKLSEEGEKER